MLTSLLVTVAEMKTSDLLQFTQSSTQNTTDFGQKFKMSSTLQQLVQPDLLHLFLQISRTHGVQQRLQQQIQILNGTVSVYSMQLS
jgi:hypothetical protein